jgi:hypothetical protein
MQGTRPQNPKISLQREKPAQAQSPPHTPHQLDLEKRVLAELLLDIYEFNQKRKHKVAVPPDSTT